MAWRRESVDFLQMQVAGAGAVLARKMFGGHGLYCDGKLFALVCDDQLYVKPTPAGRAHIGTVKEAPPYRGAKLFLLISGESWGGGMWLTQLVRFTAAALPGSAPNKRS